MLEPILIVPDAHRPYHDPRAWSLLLKVGKALNPTHLWVLGDFADFYSVSAHSKDPARAYRFVEELTDVLTGLAELDALGPKHKIFIEGNHEDRLRRYLCDRAPELHGVVSIPDLLCLPENGWVYVPYKSAHRVGKIYLTHDVGNAGRYAAFKCLDTFQHSVLSGHAHRMSYVVEGNAVGEYKVSAMFGWLGDLTRVDYLHNIKAKTSWPLGFGIGYLETTTGIVYLLPVPIISYTCVVNGTLFSAP